MVRSILTTPLNGAFGMGVIKKLWAEARVEGIATANRTVQETEVRDNRVGIRNLQPHREHRILSVALAWQGPVSSNVR
jgi:hypothetical protein